MGNDEVLLPFQIEVAKTFFSLSESAGFAMAGGAALVALHLSTRATQDLDIFSFPPESSVISAATAFREEVGRRGWSFKTVSESKRFYRAEVRRDTDVVLVDLGIDSGPTPALTITFLGPTVSGPDAAARKLLALFDRAASRDFVDVFGLCQIFDRIELLAAVQEIDLGFDLIMFQERLGSHTRFYDAEFKELGIENVGSFREFFDQWAQIIASR